jgi:hypothetical protein
MFEGGDNKYLNGSNGQCGCFAMEGCCYCTSRTSDFHLTLVALRAVNTRVFEWTLKWQMEASQVELAGLVFFQYVRPYCSKNAVKVADHGPTGSEASRRMWQQQNASQRFNYPLVAHRPVPEYLQLTAHQPADRGPIVLAYDPAGLL